MKRPVKHFSRSKLAEKTDFDQSPQTGVALADLKAIGKAISAIPGGKNLFKKTQRLLVC